MATEPLPKIAAPQDADASNYQASGMVRPRVILADTDPQFRRLLEFFLEEAGYSVTVVDDGYAALDRIRLEPPALLITEVLVPMLDGLSLCRLLKADKVTTKVPIIVYSVLDCEARVRDSGADGFMKKPIEKKRLLDLVRSLSPLQPVQGEA